MNENTTDWLESYVDHIVCADLKDGFVIYGTVDSYDAHAITFRDADFHDPREANSSKEVYAIETQSIGVRVNRKRCQVARNNVIAVCLLSELT